MDFSEDGLRVVAGVVPRRLPPSKPPEKNSDTLRRIFSAHKKVTLSLLVHCSSAGTAGLVQSLPAPYAPYSSFFPPFFNTFTYIMEKLFGDLFVKLTKFILILRTINSLDMKGSWIVFLLDL